MATQVHFERFKHFTPIRRQLQVSSNKEGTFPGKTQSRRPTRTCSISGLRGTRKNIHNTALHCILTNFAVLQLFYTRNRRSNKGKEYVQSTRHCRTNYPPHSKYTDKEGIRQKTAQLENSRT